MLSIEEIFELAVQLPVVERETYLDEVCQGDSTLRDQLAHLLADSEAADGFFSVSIEGGVLPSSQLFLEEPGSTVGCYKLLSLIGEGGFGTVYLAEQEEPISRMVAVKVVKAGMDTKQILARFEAERQALAMMDHPNIAKFHDAGATESGRPYFAMELVEGVPITEFCNQHRLNITQRVLLVRDVCLAVNHAHQKAIIHRDIKPSNVLVLMVDDKPLVKVIDFGIAKARGFKLTEKMLITLGPQLLGTPAYMSPEQVGLGGVDIDTRSDIYSIGALLYELLAGEPPFNAKKITPGHFDELRRSIRREEAPRLGTRYSRLDPGIRKELARACSATVENLQKSLRGELDWIVMKAIEKDRTRRYESANAFARDLERYLKNEPVEAAPPSPFYRLKKFTIRNRAVLAWLAAMAVVMLLSGIIISLQIASNRRNAAVNATLRIDLAREVAREVANSYSGSFNEIDLGKKIQKFKDLKREPRDASEMVLQHFIRAALSLREAEQLLELEAPSEDILGKAKAKVEEAKNTLRALELPESMNFTRDLELAQGLHLEACIYKQKGNADAAREAFENALAVRLQVLDRSESWPAINAVVGTFAALGDIDFKGKNHVDAKARFEDAERVLNRFEPEEGDQRERFLRTQVMVLERVFECQVELLEKDQWAKTASQLEGLIGEPELIEQPYREIADYHRTNALRFNQEGDAVAAIKAMRESLRVRKAVASKFKRGRDKDTSDLAIIEFELGLLLENQENDDAEEFFRKARERFMELRDKHPQNKDYKKWLDELEMKLGQSPREENPAPGHEK